MGLASMLVKKALNETRNKIKRCKNCERYPYVHVNLNDETPFLIFTCLCKNGDTCTGTDLDNVIERWNANQK